MVDDDSDWPICLSLEANGGNDWLIRLRLAASMTGKWCWCCDNGSHPDKQHLDRVCLKHSGSVRAQLPAKGRESRWVGTRGGRSSCRSQRVSLLLENKLISPGRPVSSFLRGGWGAALKYVGGRTVNPLARWSDLYQPSRINLRCSALWQVAQTVGLLLVQRL